MSAEAIKNNQKLINGDRKKQLLNKTKGTIQGAFTGLVGGVMYGYFKSKNIYTTGFVGLVIGGVISSILIGNFSEETE
jgi:hypothetical protein